MALVEFMVRVQKNQTFFESFTLNPTPLEKIREINY